MPRTQPDVDAPLSCPPRLHLGDFRTYPRVCRVCRVCLVCLVERPDSLRPVVSLLEFTVTARDPASRARRGFAVTAHGRIETPAFMAVGTRATVTGLTPGDLGEIGTQVVLGNTYHLMLRPGPELFRRVGGIHRFMRWDGPVLTDSGGYQIFSLAADRTVSEKGAQFRSYTDGRPHLLSPERSIEIQTAIGSDIMMVLDVCLNSTTDVAALRDAMERTHRWALRSLAARADSRQALFAIVQGGVNTELRRESAGFLVEHPFDGFALGGLSVGDTRSEREDITHFAAALLPADRPRYLMGVGTPGRSPARGGGRYRSLRLRAPDAPRVAGDGVHLDRSREGHARPGRAGGRAARRRVRLLDVRDVQPRVPAPPLQVQRAARPAAPLDPQSPPLSRAHGRGARGHRAGAYAAFAKQKLEAIDRHEHSDRRFGRASLESSA